MPLCNVQIVTGAEIITQNCFCEGERENIFGDKGVFARN